jgi:hypothetical protein
VVGSDLLASGGTAYAITLMQTHEAFDPQNLRNDVAVLKIGEEAAYNAWYYCEHGISGRLEI